MDIFRRFRPLATRGTNFVNRCDSRKNLYSGYTFFFFFRNFSM